MNPMKDNPCPRQARSHFELITEIEWLEAQNKKLIETLTEIVGFVDCDHQGDLFKCSKHCKVEYAKNLYRQCLKEIEE
jgi:hypothetical protein